MSGDIDKHDDRGRLIYHKSPDGFEVWWERDENDNVIYGKNSNGYEIWQEFDEKNRKIYYKDCYGVEGAWRYNKNGREIKLTERELEEIKFRRQEQEFLSREEVSRFELVEL